MTTRRVAILADRHALAIDVVPEHAHDMMLCAPPRASRRAADRHGIAAARTPPWPMSGREETHMKVRRVSAMVMAVGLALVGGPGGSSTTSATPSPLPRLTARGPPIGRTYPIQTP